MKSCEELALGAESSSAPHGAKPTPRATPEEYLSSPKFSAISHPSLKKYGESEIA